MFNWHCNFLQRLQAKKISLAEKNNRKSSVFTDCGVVFSSMRLAFASFLIFIAEKFMQTKEQKKEIIDNLSQDLKENKVLVMADFRGLSVEEANQLKKTVKEVGGKVKVAKKTLLNLALKENGVDFDSRQYPGPLTFIFGPEETEVPKKVFSFAKKNDKLKIEGGILEKQILSSLDVVSLAKMPGKQELLAQLVGTINAPISGFIRTLSGNLSGLVNVIKALADKK